VRGIPIKVRDPLSDHFFPRVTDKTFDRGTRFLDAAPSVHAEKNVLDVLEDLTIFSVALRLFSDLLDPLFSPDQAHARARGKEQKDHDGDDLPDPASHRRVQFRRVPSNDQ